MSKNLRKKIGKNDGSAFRQIGKTYSPAGKEEPVPGIGRGRKERKRRTKYSCQLDIGNTVYYTAYSLLRKDSAGGIFENT